MFIQGTAGASVLGNMDVPKETAFTKRHAKQYGVKSVCVSKIHRHYAECSRKQDSLKQPLCVIMDLRKGRSVKAMKFTKEQLNTLDKDFLIQLFLNQQEQLEAIDQKLQLVLEQIAAANHQRFGRSCEKLDIDNQIAFCEVDGQLVFFNEAEAV